MGPGQPYGLNESPATWTARARSRAPYGEAGRERSPAVAHLSPAGADTSGQSTVAVGVALDGQLIITVRGTDGSKITCWFGADGSVTGTLRHLD